MTVDRSGGALKKIPFEQVLECARGLIRMQAYSGQEEKLVKHLSLASQWLVFTNAFSDRMGNLFAVMVVGSGEGPRIVLTGHLDTVSANPAEWDAQTQPFAGSVVDGRLYGRGASDMKASFAAMFHAAASLAGLAGPFNGRVYVVGTVIEELFEGVCFLEALKKLQPDIVVVGETTEGRINIGQRGRAEIIFTVYGEPQHASTGRKVINAIEQVAYVIDAFHVWYRSEEDELLGRRNIVPTDIKIPVGGGGGSTGAAATRPSPTGSSSPTTSERPRRHRGEHPAPRQGEHRPGRGERRQALPAVQALMIQFSSERSVTWTGVAIEEKKFAPAWKTSWESDRVLKAMAGAEKATGKKPQLGSYGFCTDGSGGCATANCFRTAA